METNNKCMNNIQQDKKRIRFEIPMRPDYIDISSRLETFEIKSWPPQIPQAPQQLAEAGFYYTGNKYKI